MKKIVIIACLILVVSLSKSAYGINIAGGNLYVKGKVGAVFTDDSNLKDADLGVVGEIIFDTTYNSSLALGYENRLNSFRIEAEVGFMNVSIDQLNTDIGSFDGREDISVGRLMLNGYYDMNTGPITPYIGAGVGLAQFDGSFNTPFPDDPELVIDDIVFAWQIMAGIDIVIWQRLSVDLGYGIFATDKPNFDRYEAEFFTHGMNVSIKIRL